MLSNIDFQREIKEGTLRITPFNPNEIQPSSYDLKVGRVIGNILDVQQERDETGNEITVYMLGPGETAMILTEEKVYLSELIGGHVDLTNEFASKGIHLLNPGHIDPGWGWRKDDTQRSEGDSLTAIVRNVSNQPQPLKQGKKVLTLTLSYLRTPTDIPYGKTHPPIHELAREGKLAQAVKEIALFVEEQRRLKERLEKVEGDLGSKVAWPDLLNNLAFIIAAVSIVISVTIGIVTMSSQFAQIGISIGVNNYMISYPLFLLLVLPVALLLIGYVWRRATRGIGNASARN